MAFEGKGAIVHDLPPDATFLGGRLNYHNVGWVAFKVHDGASAWGESRHVTRAYVDELRHVFHGPVHGWGYVYCDGLTSDSGVEVDADGVPLSGRGDGVPELEAAAATTQLATLGLDGYIADLEKQCEGNGALVVRFANAFDDGWDGVVGGPIKTPFGGPRAAFVWANTDGHDAYPATEILRDFLRGQGTLMPMVYRPTWGADSIVGWRQLRGVNNVVPTVSIYAAEQQDTVNDVSQLLSAGHPGVALWAFDAFLYATSLSPRAVVERSAWFRQLRVGDAVPNDVDSEMYRGPLFRIAGSLANAGFSDGVLIQQVIRWAKGEISKDDLKAAIDAAS